MSHKVKKPRYKVAGKPSSQPHLEVLDSCRGKQCRSVEMYPCVVRVLQLPWMMSACKSKRPLPTSAMVGWARACGESEYLPMPMRAVSSILWGEEELMVLPDDVSISPCRLSPAVKHSRTRNETLGTCWLMRSVCVYRRAPIVVLNHQIAILMSTERRRLPCNSRKQELADHRSNHMEFQRVLP